MSALVRSWLLPCQEKLFGYLKEKPGPYYFFRYYPLLSPPSLIPAGEEMTHLKPRQVEAVSVSPQAALPASAPEGSPPGVTRSDLPPSPTKIKAQDPTRLSVGFLCYFSHRALESRLPPVGCRPSAHLSRL